MMSDGTLVSITRLSVVGNSVSIERDRDIDLIYMVFCGSPENTLDLIKTALDTAKEALPAGEYIDHTFKRNN